MPPPIISKEFFTPIYLGLSSSSDEHDMDPEVKYGLIRFHNISTDEEDTPKVLLSDGTSEIVARV